MANSNSVGEVNNSLLHQDEFLFNDHHSADDGSDNCNEYNSEEYIAPDSSESIFVVINSSGIISYNYF